MCWETKMRGENTFLLRCDKNPTMAFSDLFETKRENERVRKRD